MTTDEPDYRFRQHLSKGVWHDYDIDTQKGVCGEPLPDMVSFAVVETDPQPRCTDCRAITTRREVDGG